MQGLYCIVGRKAAGRHALEGYAAALYGYTTADREAIPSYKEPVDYPVSWRGTRDLPAGFTHWGITAESLEKGCLLFIHETEIDALKAFPQVRIVMLDSDRDVCAQRLLKDGYLSVNEVYSNLNRDDTIFPGLMTKADYVIDTSRMTPSEVATKLHSYILFNEARMRREREDTK